MRFRIYADESGTHSPNWLILGMLFVPDHGALHSELCKAKDRLKYFSASPKKKARYKETHLVDFRSDRDVHVAREWISLFVKHSCYFRCIVIDWSIWDSKYFGDPFESEELKKRRAYKKWAEMLLHPEIKSPSHGSQIYHARFFLDKLRIMYGYDVLHHLEERFCQNYSGDSPHIEEFQHVDSWRDAHQCLQLCDLLTGCQHQALTPASSRYKLAARDYLIERLAQFGVKELRPGFWKQYDAKTLNKHMPKFSAWFWKPTVETKKRARKKAKRNR